MNRLYYLILGSVLLWMTPNAGLATGFIYECDMSGVDRGRGWISPTVAFVLPGDGSVQVVDAVTLHVANGPVPGRVLRNTETRLVVWWTVKDAQARGGARIAHFDYRASLSKQTGKIELSARPRQFDGGLRSSGTCQQRNK